MSKGVDWWSAFFENSHNTLYKEGTIPQTAYAAASSLYTREPQKEGRVRAFFGGSFSP